MSDPRDIRIEDFDYNLPLELIAQHPLEKRDQSRLLIYRQKNISESVFTQLPSLLPAGSLLVFNDTRVIRARLIFYKTSGGRIEIFCLEPVAPTPDLQQAFAARDESHWKCYVGNLKKWKTDKLSIELYIGGKPVSLSAEKTGSEKDTVFIKFTWSDTTFSFSEVMEAAGHIPLPPYITRNDDSSDAHRYQTIFAREQGSVAAPTAGLHFTEPLLDEIRNNGIATARVTLHVGAGTFKPVTSDAIGDHAMHFEQYSVSRSFVESLTGHVGKPLIPVGTTSMRTLESLYWLGCRVHDNPRLASLTTTQWEPYQDDNGKLSTQQALNALLDFMHLEKLNVLHASTGLMIVPAYRFRLCSGLITNFHLPKSTLLLLVAALAGSDWKKAYEYALEKEFRFLSYGDSCLFLP
jgi:S-adenosylmethionine:tRNA ribosyltransferase-isomerase